MAHDSPRVYRMPVALGLAHGPRQAPSGGPFAAGDSHRTTASVHFRTEHAALARLLPRGFEPARHPIGTVFRTELENLAWLAGRGYAMFGLRFPARYRGRRDDVSGLFLAVLWENRAEPIVTGREELGFAKVYGELPAPESQLASYRFRAAWEGTVFAEVELDRLEPSERAFVPDYGLASNAGQLHYKYVPRTGAVGEADAEYATLGPAGDSSYRVSWTRNGTGRARFLPNTWEKLPTLFNIVSAVASLPAIEWLGASLEHGIGGKDLSDQRALA